MRIELADTLLALLGALPGDGDAGLQVTDVDVSLPMEVSVGEVSGSLRFWAHPAHTRWCSGVLPAMHTFDLHVVPAGDEAWA